MTHRSSILLVGHDKSLLETRQWLLEAAGFRVSICADPGALSEALSFGRFRLLIVCHTLSMAERGMALGRTHMYWPSPNTLVLTPELCANPDQLLAEVTRAIAPPPSISCSPAGTSRLGGRHAAAAPRPHAA